MSKLHFVHIKDCASHIIQAVMDTPELQSHPDLNFTLNLAVEEIVVNIVSYAYPEGTDGELDIEVHADEEAMTLTFADKGIPFNPLAKEDPDTTLGIEERPIGGLGIFLVKQMMDSVSYRYEEGRNVLIIKKKIEKGK